MKKKLEIPRFKNEDEEREFWAKIDFSEYTERKDWIRVRFPKLKPTSRSISIRLPEYILARLKQRANAINIPYQSLIKVYLQEKLFPQERP